MFVCAAARRHQRADGCVAGRLGAVGSNPDRARPAARRSGAAQHPQPPTSPEHHDLTRNFPEPARAGRRHDSEAWISPVLPRPAQPADDGICWVTPSRRPAPPGQLRALARAIGHRR